MSVEWPVVDILFGARKEVRIIGILDSVFAASLLVILLLLGIFYDFVPNVMVWIWILTVHAIQLCIAASLITAGLEVSSVNVSVRKCQIWYYYSRFFFDWMFPVECFFLIMFIKANGSQYLWIICGIVNVVFRIVAEKSVSSYITNLKAVFQPANELDLSDFNNTSIP